MVDMHITFQGGIDLLENPFNTAERELLEETGISSITFLAQVGLIICQRAVLILDFSCKLRHCIDTWTHMFHSD